MDTGTETGEHLLVGGLEQVEDVLDVLHSTLFHTLEHDALLGILHETELAQVPRYAAVIGRGDEVGQLLIVQLDDRNSHRVLKPV